MQTEIPVPLGLVPIRPCRWCGKPAAGTIELHKARYTGKDGFRRLIKPAFEVPACAAHLASIVRTPDAEE